ncbi:MAG: hypothetical protein ACYDH5_14655 [Acidimicrobiales bacterium]
MTLTLGLLIAILAVVITGFFSLVAFIVNQVGRLDTKIEALRTELKGDIAGLRTELKGDIAAQGAQITHLAEAVGRIEGKLDEHLRRHDAVAS